MSFEERQKHPLSLQTPYSKLITYVQSFIHQVLIPI